MANGKIKADTLEHSTAGSLDTLYVVRGSTKAWSSLDGSGGSTTTQHGSLNISSVLDDGVGQYGFNFGSNMNGATYSSVGCGGDNANFNCVTNWTGVPDTYTSGRTGMGILNVSNSQYSDSDVCITVNGDLA